MRFLGILAAILTTSSFVPQAYQTIKTKDVSGISLGMYSVFVIGLLLWIMYGLYIGDIPMILANFGTFLFAVMILICKIKYGGKWNGRTD